MQSTCNRMHGPPGRGAFRFCVPVTELVSGLFDELGLATSSFFECKKDTLLEHSVEPHRHELLLGAGAQRDPVAFDGDAQAAERAATARHGRRTLRRIPQRIATV